MTDLPAEADVRARLAAYLGGRATLGEFWDWFVPATWAAGTPGTPPGLTGLVYAIKLRVYEHTRGHLPEPGLRDRLRACLAPGHPEA